MGSLEPSLGRDGYPLLLQTGETADGTNPLFDRQHPHDVLMELGATYHRPIGKTDSVFLYVAPRGEPALGTTAFMHRWSSEGNPVAPLAHHWLDATHITYGVVTVGWARSNRVKIEGSVFNGREPDEARWNVDRLRLNSFSGRFTLNPSPNWSFQASAAQLDSPETLHDGINVLRMTASVSYNRPLRNGNWQTTLAWGRNKRQPSEGVSTTSTTTAAHLHLTGGGSSLEPQVQAQGAVVLESAIRVKSAHTLFGRLEWAEKDELFLAADRRHSLVFDVSKLSVGYLFELPDLSIAKLGLGAYASWHGLPEDLLLVYGEQPRTLAVFARVRLN
jgi:hypothetical protein